MLLRDAPCHKSSRTTPILRGRSSCHHHEFLGWHLALSSLVDNNDENMMAVVPRRLHPSLSFSIILDSPLILTIRRTIPRYRQSIQSLHSIRVHGRKLKATAGQCNAPRAAKLQRSSHRNIASVATGQEHQVLRGSEIRECAVDNGEMPLVTLENLATSGQAHIGDANTVWSHGPNRAVLTYARHHQGTDGHLMPSSTKIKYIN